MAFSMFQSKAGTGDAFRFTGERSCMEVWPALGFNCVRWDVRDGDDWRPVLYRTPDFETNPVPTRNGHPILFPFPNRLRNGRFTFEGREYQLPLNDSSGPNAIHGFTPRNPWRMIDSGCGSEQAWITGEFRLSLDRPEALELWPADARIRVTYRLFDDRLHVDAAIDAADGKRMPFGLGYHPYFTLGGSLADWRLKCATERLWESQSNLPTGRQLSTPANLDFRTERVIADTELDTLYHVSGGTKNVAVLSMNGRRLTVHIDPSFGELLLFIPPHRQAVAIEPYTCITDAANLQAAGVETGWRILAAGESYSSAVEYRIV